MQRHGPERCYVVGQNAEEWGEDAPERAYLGLEWARRPGMRRSAAKIVRKRSVRPRVTCAGRCGVGVSASFLRARLMVEKVADAEATVLLVGESGVGKELFSQQLHRLSRGRQVPAWR